MKTLWRTGSRGGFAGFAVVSALAATMVAGNITAAGHHDCDEGEHRPCPICYHLSAKICPPEVAPRPAFPVLACELVSHPGATPVGMPLLANAARGPPLYHL